MIYWAPLLHFYQPPTQVHWVLKKVCQESYRPLVKLFQELPYAKVTVNINGVLTEMLDDHGMSDVITGLRKLGEKGQIEFTGSGRYHPILPLIPREEMFRQIVQNHQINSRFFGSAYTHHGFFPPEMCYSRDIVKPVLDTDHQWMILSGVACPVDWPMDIIHEIEYQGERLAVFFRDDVLSNRVSFRQTDATTFIKDLKGLKGNKQDIYIITAMDAETFGHHIPRWEEIFLAEVYETLQNTERPAKENKGSPKHRDLMQPLPTAEQHSDLLRTVEAEETIKVVTICELLDLFPRGQRVDPQPSSWSTTKDDLKVANPYPLWKAQGNTIHQFQWQTVKIAIEITHKAMGVATTEDSRRYAEIARGVLDSALHSDQFWWASRAPHWDVNLVNRGLMELREVILNAYKAIKLSPMSEEEKTEYYYRVIASREIRNKITDQLFLT